MIDVSRSGHYIGDCRELLRELPDKCVQTCITSPPYWGLRDYGVDGQLGLEATPEQYIIDMVECFDGVWRVLRDDGTLWLNLGDSYASIAGGYDESGSRGSTAVISAKTQRAVLKGQRRHPPSGLKAKDLIGIPWRVAFALQAAGWYLRSDIIWHKPNPMPESVTDRPTKAHEYLFLLSKSASYFYDADAIAETASRGSRGSRFDIGKTSVGQRRTSSLERVDDESRNKRTVWTVATTPYDGAHFATFPPALIEPCVLAGSRAGDVVLDPFFGSGTTGQVAEKHGRRWIGFDINPAYEALQKERTAQRSLPMGGGEP